MVGREIIKVYHSQLFYVQSFIHFCARKLLLLILVLKLICNIFKVFSTK